MRALRAFGQWGTSAQTSVILCPSRRSGAIAVLPDGVLELPGGRLVNQEGEVVYAYSSYDGCPWLIETRGRRRISTGP